MSIESSWDRRELHTVRGQNSQGCNRCACLRGVYDNRVSHILLSYQFNPSSLTSWQSLFHSSWYKNESNTKLLAKKVCRLGSPPPFTDRFPYRTSIESSWNKCELPTVLSWYDNEWNTETKCLRSQVSTCESMVNTCSSSLIIPDKTFEMKIPDWSITSSGPPMSITQGRSKFITQAAHQRGKLLLKHENGSIKSCNTIMFTMLSALNSTLFSKYSQSQVFLKIFYKWMTLFCYKL